MSFLGYKVTLFLLNNLWLCMYLPFCSSFYVFVQKTDSQAVFVQEWITPLWWQWKKLGLIRPNAKLSVFHLCHDVVEI